MIPRSAVIDAIARSPWTALVFSADGQVVEMVPFDAEPTAKGVLSFAATVARGRRYRFVRQAPLGEDQLAALLAETTTPAPARGKVAVPGGPIHEFQPKFASVCAGAGDRGGGVRVDREAAVNE